MDLYDIRKISFVLSNFENNVLDIRQAIYKGIVDHKCQRSPDTRGTVSWSVLSGDHPALAQ